MNGISLNNIILSDALPKLDSLTKYPSILTYHNLGQKGGMINSLVEDRKFEGPVEITEKVDGSNFRLIYFKDDYLIGKRDCLVHAMDDRIITEPLVKTVLDSCSDFINTVVSNSLIVIYGEVYGDNVQRGSKQYCGDEKKRGFRVFDVAILAEEEIECILTSYDMNKIVALREHTSNRFLSTDMLKEFCDKYKLERTPIWGTYDGSKIPIQVEETLNWMEENFTESKSTLGERPVNANQLFGRAEGVVIRTPDRSLIRKLRFEDYRKGKLKGWI